MKERKKEKETKMEERKQDSEVCKYYIAIRSDAAVGVGKVGLRGGGNGKGEGKGEN